MTNESRPTTIDHAQVEAVFRRVREIDSNATYEAVERYMREITEMADALRVADIGSVLPTSGYSPAWEGSEVP